MSNKWSQRQSMKKYFGRNYFTTFWISDCEHLYRYHSIEWSFNCLVLLGFDLDGNLCWYSILGFRFKLFNFTTQQSTMKRNKLRKILHLWNWKSSADSFKIFTWKENSQRHFFETFSKLFSLQFFLKKYSIAKCLLNWSAKLLSVRKT